MFRKIAENKLLNAIINIVEGIIIFILVVLIGLTLIQRFSNSGSFFGYRIYTVASDSMLPLYGTGDTLLVKKVDVKEIKQGDAISYLGEADINKNMIITHRVENIEATEDGLKFHTKGIANHIEDPIVDADQILGKVIYRFKILSVFGKITTNMTTLLIFLIVPISILVAIEVIRMIAEAKKKAEAKKLEMLKRHSDDDDDDDDDED
jgi:signal peptidase I